MCICLMLKVISALLLNSFYQQSSFLHITPLIKYFQVIIFFRGHVAFNCLHAHQWFTLTQVCFCKIMSCSANDVKKYIVAIHRIQEYSVAPVFLLDILSLKQCHLKDNLVDISCSTSMSQYDSWSCHVICHSQWQIFLAEMWLAIRNSQLGLASLTYESKQLILSVHEI